MVPWEGAETPRERTCNGEELNRYGRRMATHFDEECFFIAPIGEAESDIRKRSDGVRDWVVKPAAELAANLETVRADDVGKPGQITAQAVQHCLKAKAAVADLTGGNPNVYYELSVRHGALLPVVLIAEEGTKLPFDISQSRVIFFDHTDLRSAGKARGELQAQIEASLSGPPDNPISDGMRLAQLQAGNVEEQTLAAVLDRMQRISQAVDQIDGQLRRNEMNQRFEPSPQRRIVGAAGGKLIDAPIITEWTTREADGTLHRFHIPTEAGENLTPLEKAEIEREFREEHSPPSEGLDPQGET
jgi:hypothetical protein